VIRALDQRDEHALNQILREFTVASGEAAQEPMDLSEVLNDQIRDLTRRRLAA